MESNKRKLLTSVGAFKLGNSLVKIVRSANKDLLDGRADYVDFLKIDMANEMSRQILKANPKAITEREDENGNKVFEFRMLVLSMEDYKTVVEATIAMMPYEAILKIRGEK